VSTPALGKKACVPYIPTLAYTTLVGKKHEVMI